jgi:hypothetical protein
MTALLSGLVPYLIAAGGALIAFFAYGARQRVVGAQRERVAQAEREKAARDVADQVDNDIGAMPPKDAREELRKWSTQK